MSQYITVSIPSVAEMNDLKLRILCLEQRVKEHGGKGSAKIGGDRNADTKVTERSKSAVDYVPGDVQKIIQQIADAVDVRYDTVWRKFSSPDRAADFLMFNNFRNLKKVLNLPEDMTERRFAETIYNELKNS